jgi:hypothetical protein
VGNFPAVQPVAITNGQVPVREADVSRSVEFSTSLASSEKRAFGPIPLDGRKRIQIQVNQIYPTTPSPTPLTLHWYVRYGKEDPFFRSCPRETSATPGSTPPACTTGFAGGSARLRPSVTTTLADLQDGFYILPATTPVAIRVLDVIGAEALLVMENAASGPRQLRVNLILDR